MTNGIIQKTSYAFSLNHLSELSLQSAATPILFEDLKIFIKLFLSVYSQKKLSLPGLFESSQISCIVPLEQNDMHKKKKNRATKYIINMVCTACLENADLFGYIYHMREVHTLQ